MVLKKNNVERVADTDAQIAKLESQGFKCVEYEKILEAPKAPEEKPDLKSLKVEELKALAKDKGIDGAASLTKDELLSVLKDVI